MAENKQDALARAYATLKSLRTNIAEMTDAKETYVNEFHTVLIRLQDIGINVSEFWILDSEVKPKVTSVSPVNYIGGGGGGGHVIYSKEKYVDKSYLLFKIDAILGYFEIITAEKPKRIGFTKSNE